MQHQVSCHTPMLAVQYLHSMSSCWPKPSCFVVLHKETPFCQANTQHPKPKEICLRQPLHLATTTPLVPVLCSPHRVLLHHNRKNAHVKGRIGLSPALITRTHCRHAHHTNTAATATIMTMHACTTGTPSPLLQPTKRSYSTRTTTSSVRTKNHVKDAGTRQHLLSPQPRALTSQWHD